jgi:hypothetical protein
MRTTRDIIFRKRMNNKHGLFSFQARSVKTDKFSPHPRIMIHESITTESTTCHYAYC